MTNVYVGGEDIRFLDGLDTGVEDGDEVTILPAAGAGRNESHPPADAGGFAAHLRRRGIAGELLLERAQLTGKRRGGVAGLLDRLRARAERGVVAKTPQFVATCCQFPTVAVTGYDTLSLNGLPRFQVRCHPKA